MPLMLGSFMLTSVYGFTDSDKDGISDNVEYRLGLDPFKKNLPAQGTKENPSPECLPGTTMVDRYNFHVMNRLSFGPNAKLLREIEYHNGGDSWLIDQLEYPQVSKNDNIDTAQQKLNDFIFLSNGFGNSSALQTFATVRPLHSEHQLQVVMGRFWENHFNTEFKKHKNINSEMLESDAFYLNAFGNFEDLLNISAKSPAMLQYLDGFKSTKMKPNENYAREVMELHTLGINGGYIAQDIVALSKIFTGWSIQRDQDAEKCYRYRNIKGGDGIPLKKFVFYNKRHDKNNKIFLGKIITNKGQKEGKIALRMLARHSKTATFICQKLAKFFVSDKPTKDTINQCRKTFIDKRDESDQIAQVLKTLFRTDEFRHTYRNKIKDTQEYILSVARLLELNATKYRGKNQLQYLGRELFRTGQSFFDKPEPTGYAEASSFWNNTSVAMKRLQFVNHILLKKRKSALTRSYSLRNFFKREYGNEVTERDIIFYLLPITTGGYYTGEDVQRAYTLLNPSNEDRLKPFRLKEKNLRNLVSWLVSRAEFNVQ